MIDSGCRYMIKQKNKKEPVYEHLGPNECLIISKTDEELLVACNKEGEVHIKRIRIPDKEE